MTIYQPHIAWQLRILLAWFAGLIDGEGCFTISISFQHRHSLHISPRFSIALKEGDWADRVSSILQVHQIPFHVRMRKNQVELTVSSGVAVKKLIRLVLPYLVVKRPLASRLLDFPVARTRNGFVRVSEHYVNTVCELVDYVRQFNKGKNRMHKWDGRSIRRFFQE